METQINTFTVEYMTSGLSSTFVGSVVSRKHDDFSARILRILELILVQTISADADSRYANTFCHFIVSNPTT